MRQVGGQFGILCGDIAQLVGVLHEIVEFVGLVVVLNVLVGCGAQAAKVLQCGDGFCAVLLLLAVEHR